jgi:prophage regulatory protein
MSSTDQSERRPRRMIKLLGVTKKTALGKSSIYEAITEGTFPAPIRLGPRAVAWVEDEIDAWLEARIAQRDQAKPPKHASRIAADKQDERHAHRKSRTA